MKTTDRNGYPALMVSNGGEIQPISKDNPLHIRIVGGGAINPGAQNWGTLLNEEQTKSLETLSEATKDYTEVSYNVIRDIRDTGLSSKQSSLAWPFFHKNNEEYKGKEVEVGLNIVNPGNITFTLIKVDDSRAVTKVKEVTKEATNAWPQWFDPEFGIIPENGYIGVQKPGDTAKFYYGGAGGLSFFQIDTGTNMVPEGYNTGTGDFLNVGFRTKTEAQKSGTELLEKTIDFAKNNLQEKQEEILTEVYTMYPKEIATGISNGQWPFISASPQLYRGYEVELGVLVATAGTITFALYTTETDTTDAQLTLVKEITKNFEKVGEYWFRPDFGVIPSNGWIAVSKTGDTGRFYYGGTAQGIPFMNLTGKTGLIASPSAGAHLNIGVRTITPKTTESNISEIEEKANITSSLYGKTYAVTGDSISTLAGLTTYGNSLYYVNSKYEINAIEHTYWGKFAELTGMRVIQNEAWSGSRVSGGGAGLNAHRSLKMAPADIITIMIGINDLSGNVPLGDFTPDKPQADLQNTNITESYMLMLEKMMKNNPNSRIICLTPMHRFTNNTTTWKNTNGIGVKELTERIIEICNHYGIEYVDMRGVGFNKHNYRIYMPDGLHPNRVGAMRIGEYLAGKIS